MKHYYLLKKLFIIELLYIIIEFSEKSNEKGFFYLQKVIFIIERKISK